MCFQRKKTPVRLQKKESIRDKYEKYINAELIIIIAFIIIFILAVIFAIGETSWYNIPNGGV